MDEDSLDRNQRAELERLRALNAKWVARPIRQRLGLVGLAVAGHWLFLGLFAWLVSTQTGVSPAGVVVVVLMAVAVAAPLFVGAFWPDRVSEYGARSLPRNDQLDRPFFAAGGIRLQDYAGNEESSAPRRTQNRFETAAEVAFGLCLLAGVATLGGGAVGVWLLATGAVGLAGLAVARFATGRWRGGASRMP